MESMMSWLASLPTTTMAIIAGVVMIVLLLMGYPMMVPLLAGAMLLLFTQFAFLDGSVLVQQMIGGISQSVLVAVPMFILAADIMIKGHTADRMLDVVAKFVGERLLPAEIILLVGTDIVAVTHNRITKGRAIR